jgi:hypothetical protein
LHKLSKQEPFNINLKNKYKQYRNKLTEIIAKAKYSYFGEKVKNNSSNPKIIWSIIKQATHQNVAKSPEINLKINNITYNFRTNASIITNKLNDFFLTMGDLNGNISNKEIEYNNNNPSCSLYLRKITRTEIYKIITDMKNDSAPGPDTISINVIKNIKDFISDILEKIFKQILKEGIIPDAFKNALISPIYKGKGSKTDLSNFRPISLLNVFSKIFEKAIKTRLVNYLEENNLLPISQYGFRKGLGTEDALANLTKDIYDNLDNHNKTIGIFLDLSKAFDSIPHPKLLNCIKSFGITGSSYSIFKSYLEGRSQQVKVGDKLSDIGIIHRGVPQGTVLSPILYIMYVSALDRLSL